MRAKWSLQQIQAWWKRQPWPVGANYVPSDAVNDVQMWIGETFNPDLIRRELSWAAELGMNTMRVFLPLGLRNAFPGIPVFLISVFNVQSLRVFLIAIIIPP